MYEAIIQELIDELGTLPGIGFVVMGRFLQSVDVADFLCTLRTDAVSRVR